MRLLDHAIDHGAIIALLFVALTLYVILCVFALFPATWRMTDKEKEKIPDKDQYQKKYASVFVALNVLLSGGHVLTNISDVPLVYLDGE